jgi:hypothetical protein
MKYHLIQHKQKNLVTQIHFWVVIANNHWQNDILHWLTIYLQFAPVYEYSADRLLLMIYNFTINSDAAVD